MTYNEWLKSQSDEFQNEALGKKKAQAFRAGRHKVEKYVEHGKPLTLDELKQTDDFCIKGR